MFAARMRDLDMSGVRRMFELAAQMKHPVDLSVGQPDFDVPETIKEAAIAAIRQGRNGYTVAAGVRDLRDAIGRDLAREGVTPAAIMAVPGASAGLVLALLALADGSTEVLIPDPAFMTYGHMARLAGAKVRWIDIYPDFRLTVERLEAAVRESASDRTIRNRILIFNSPVNPTGVAYTGAEVRALAAATRRLGIQVLADEVYDRFRYGSAHECWLKHDPDAILVRGFGKTWGMTGWRAGYVAGPGPVIEAMIGLQQFTTVCVHTPTQWASIRALDVDMTAVLEAYRRRRDRLCAGLGERFDVVRPEGAYYAFPRVRGADPERFLRKCLEQELLVVPGQAFSRRNTHFRVSFAVSDDTLERGVELLNQAARECGA